jgi:hypothetical protein
VARPYTAAPVSQTSINLQLNIRQKLESVFSTTARFFSRFFTKAPVQRRIHRFWRRLLCLQTNGPSNYTRLRGHLIAAGYGIHRKSRHTISQGEHQAVQPVRQQHVYTIDQRVDSGGRSNPGGITRLRPSRVDIDGWEPSAFDELVDAANDGIMLLPGSVFFLARNQTSPQYR